MSAGAFTTAFYEMSAENGGFILRARVQPETLAAIINGDNNGGVSGPATAPGSATISQGRRTAGVNMRYVTLRWTDEPPTNYSTGTVKIPVLDPAVFASWTLGATGTYLEKPVEVVGRVGETVK